MLRFLRRKSRRTVEEVDVPPDAPDADEPPLPDDPGAPAAAWAAALAVDPAALEADAGPLPPEEQDAAGEVVLHFDAHRPGPASFPSVALRVLDLVRDPDAEVPELARLVEADAALSAGVLVLANSPVYRGVSEIRTVREAVARLGLGEVARIAAALSARSLYRAEVRAEFELFGPVWDRLFADAATVARGASELARLRRLADPDRVFVAGMLHDVGKAIALRSLAALVLDARLALRDVAAVRRVLHRVHVEVGAEVHREWRLPEALGAVAARHHAPAADLADAGPELHLVRLVSALQLVRTDAALHPAAPAEAASSARALGLGPARLRALLGALAETEQWVGMLFGDGSAAAPGR